MSGAGPWQFHALRDPWPRLLCERVGIRSGDRVLDLGAGTGAMTAAALAAGARVTAVELHPGRAALLRRRFPDAEVLQGDLLALRWPRTPFRVLANPPFALTSPLLRELATVRTLLRADLVLQRAAVLRLLERGLPGGLLGSSPVRLPRSAFSPRPVVDIAVLTVRPGRGAGRRRPAGRRSTR